MFLKLAVNKAKKFFVLNTSDLFLDIHKRRKGHIWSTKGSFGGSMKKNKTLS